MIDVRIINKKIVQIIFVNHKIQLILLLFFKYKYDHLLKNNDIGKNTIISNNLKNLFLDNSRLNIFQVIKIGTIKVIVNIININSKINKTQIIINKVIKI